MKFSVNRQKLSDTVFKLSRAVAQKSSVPVLEGILFSAEQGKLTLASYNYEIGIKKEPERVLFLFISVSPIQPL